MQQLGRRGRVSVLEPRPAIQHRQVAEPASLAEDPIDDRLAMAGGPGQADRSRQDAELSRAGIPLGVDEVSGGKLLAASELDDALGKPARQAREPLVPVQDSDGIVGGHSSFLPFRLGEGSRQAAVLAWRSGANVAAATVAQAQTSILSDTTNQNQQFRWGANTLSDRRQVSREAP